MNGGTLHSVLEAAVQSAIVGGLFGALLMLAFWIWDRATGANKNVYRSTNDRADAQVSPKGAPSERSASAIVMLPLIGIFMLLIFAPYSAFTGPSKADAAWIALLGGLLIALPFSRTALRAISERRHARKPTRSMATPRVR